MSNDNPQLLSGNDQNESSLLAELAMESTGKIRAMQSETLAQQAKTQLLNSSLKRIYQFFHTFSDHVNKISPIIPRSYYVDTNTIYTNLKWQKATADYRKQDLSDNALFDHVSFSCQLLAPSPVITTRRWNQLEILKKELDIFGLRALDDLDMLVRNKSQQETFNARLAPDFLIKIKFQGNYNEGLIDISCNNFDGFGASTFKLNPENVIQEFLDDIGRFLLGRIDDLPLPLKLTRDISKKSPKFSY
jgi:hypothetical protein